MNLFYDRTESRTVVTGDGVRHRQNRFYCPVHGYFDLFVFPNAFVEHAACGEEVKPAGVGLDLLPKFFKKAA